MMPVDAPWHTIEFAFVFVMWAVMMVGMMTSSVAPLILIYTRVGRQAAAQRQPFATSAWFAGGYLLTWIFFACRDGRPVGGRAAGLAHACYVE